MSDGGASPAGACRTLEGRRVLVTGGGRGIGRAIGMSCAGRGARVAFASRTTSECDDAALEAAGMGAEAIALECDVTDEVAVAAAVAAVARTWGGLDALVNNAGFGRNAPVADTPAALWRETLEVNVTGAFLATREALPHLRASGAADVVFVLSAAVRRTYPRSAAYTASKHALRGFAEVLREEERGSGIRVLSLVPGAVDTAMWDHLERGKGRRAEMMPASAIGEAVALALEAPRTTQFEEIVVRPQVGDV